MADLRLDNNGDLDLTNDSISLVTDLAAIAQDISIRLQFFLGEWFLDTRLGIPYFQKLLGEKPNITTIKSIFRKAILSTSGVLSLSDLNVIYTGVTRQLSVTFRASTIAGELVYNKDLII